MVNATPFAPTTEGHRGRRFTSEFRQIGFRPPKSGGPPGSAIRARWDGGSERGERQSSRQWDRRAPATKTAMRRLSFFGALAPVPRWPGRKMPETANFESRPERYYSYRVEPRPSSRKISSG